MVGWQEGPVAHQNPFTNSQRFYSGTGGGGPERNRMTQVDLEK